ncbi:MAG: type III pantothenate kinase [Bacteroidales bacterium]
MNLVVDHGNTMIKVAFFHKDRCLELFTFNDLSGPKLIKVIHEFEKKNPELGHIRFGIISSVVKDISQLVNALKDRLEIFTLNSSLQVPITICYKTAVTLGNDRIAAAVGASSMFPGADLLVIDAGTCITYDFTNRNREFIGGGISPGIVMRFRALHAFTGNLPFIVGRKEAKLIGDTTENSILSGVINGVFAEIEGVSEQYRKKFPQLITVFTGGDMNYFEKYTKSDIFAVSNLVLKGLNEILKFNVKQ